MSFSTITFRVNLFTFTYVSAYCFVVVEAKMTEIYSIYHEASNFPGNKYVGKYTQISLITQKLFTLCVYVLCINVSLHICRYA